MTNAPSEKDILEAESREKFAHIYRILATLCIFVGVVSGLYAFNNFHYYLSRLIAALAIAIGIIFAYAALCSHEEVKNLRAGIHDDQEI